MWRCIFATILINNSLIFSSASAEVTAIITPEICHMVVTHIPRDDVKYLAGVDVKGRPVQPADLAPSPENAATLGQEDKISFFLIYNVFNQNGGNNNLKRIAQNYPGLKGEVNLGEIIVKNGKVTLDGKALTAEHQNQLRLFCEKNKTPKP